MFMDADLLFSDAQAVTAAAASTNYYDTGPLLCRGTSATPAATSASAELYISISSMWR
jgi:hypothetical protein